MLSLSINKSYSDLVKNIRLHLSVIGKRATNVHGESFFAELTTSSKEDKVLYDLIDAGGETISSELSDICSSYYEDEGIKFVLYNDRWEKGDETYIGDLKNALDGAIGRYLVNFALAQFLSAIFPALKESSVPMYGKPYIDHCDVILKNIKTLAFLKRPDSFSGSSYGEMLNAGSDYWDDGKIISLLTIKRNGVALAAYNGTADKVADVIVPTKLSELENDKGFLSLITNEQVLSAIGYTPFNSEYFTKGNIASVLGIYNWALAATKPSYTASEIDGLSTLLAGKYDKSSFVTDFARELGKVKYYNNIQKVGTGDYVTNIYESSDGRGVCFATSSLSSAVTAIARPLINSIIEEKGGLGGGTEVSWGSENGGYVGLTVAGVTKNLLLNNVLEKLFVPVSSSGQELGFTSSNIHAIKFKYNIFSEGSVSAYGIGSDASGGSGVSKFADLEEVYGKNFEVGQTLVWNGSNWVPGNAGGEVSAASIKSLLGNYYVLTTEFNSWKNSTKLSLWGNDVAINGGSCNDSITIKYNNGNSGNNEKSVTLEVTSEGYLHINGSIVADGAIVAYGSGDDAASGGGGVSSWNDLTDKPSWIKDTITETLSGYATESWVLSKGYITSQSLGDYATKSWVQQNYLSKDDFNDLFEKVTDNGVTYIKAKYGLASEGFLTAYGLGTDNNSGVTWEAVQTSGVVIAYIKIDGGARIPVYAPTSSGGGSVSAWTDITDRPRWLDDYCGDSKPGVSLFTNDAGYVTQSWVEGKGYLVASDLSKYGMTLWGNEVKIGGSCSDSITIKNSNGKSATLEVDSDGNLKISGTTGNLYTTGAITAYGLGSDSLVQVSSFGQLNEVDGTSPTTGQVWGKTENGYGWLNQSEGKTYNGDGTYISVSGSTISLSNALVTDLDAIRSNAQLGQYAYLWGNHSSAGYVKTWSDLGVQQSWLTDILGNYYLTSSAFATWRDGTNLTLWGNTVPINGGRADNKLTLTNGTKTVTIEVDDNGLKIDGDVYATGAVTAYGQGEDSTGSVTTFAQLNEVVNAQSDKGTGKVWGWDGSKYTWVSVVSSWSSLEGKPTKLSDFTNDVGYLTQHQSLSGYATESWVEGKGYLTQHQSLADYLKSADAATMYLGINSKAVSAGVADEAVKLQTTRSLWGQSFNGTSDIQGDIKIGVPQAEGTTEGGQITIYGCYGCSDIELDSYYNKFRIFKNDQPAWYFDVNTLDTYMPGDVMIKSVLIKYDNSTHTLSFQDLNGNLLNIVTTGGITAYGLASEAEIGTLENLTVSNTLQGKDVRATDNLYVGDLSLYDGNIYSDESIFVNSNDELYLQSSQGIFIESSAVSMDCGCSMSTISVGEAGNTSTITNIKVSGGYLYLTVGSNKYRASLTSVSSY